ncbi:hypothetical protein [Burkholderia sp. Ac-20353]|uniref:hypothetical protein n=1 Tax=Burkholderia sp. Ac-20353 TaxID=2703894 RepID=UPI00197B8C2F|nr:hypothetical protein [Burkholderia sp. Ac-20353]MBN3786992.1 hypothetical protein [Burkholderia sp. Ac-20353]
MIDEKFLFPRPPVSVVAVGDSGEALLIRAVLESLGASVSLHLPGTPQDLLLVLGDTTTNSQYLIISGHGNQDGFVMGEYDEGIDVSLLTNGSLPPDALAGNMRLQGRVVVSTACETGTSAFGRAFVDGGASAYIAPRGLPDGADAALFVHRLFHMVLARRMSIRDALRKARTYDDASEMFVGYGDVVCH